MLIALMDLSCLRILHCFKEREDYWKFSFINKGGSSSAHCSPLDFELFENPTLPRRDLEKGVEFQKEILVNLSIHDTHIALRFFITILHCIRELPTVSN